MISLLFSLALAALASDLTDSYVSLVLRAVQAAQQESYPQLYQRAIDTDRPLVVFVGCQPVAGDWLAYRCTTFPGVSGPSVVVSRRVGGELHWLATLPAGTTAAEIEAACRPVASAAPITPPAAAFRPAPAFSRSANC